MSLTSGVEDLFKSIFELFAGIVNAIVGAVTGAINLVLSFFTGIFTMAGDVFKGLVDVVGGITHFVLGNIVIIGIIAAAGFFYVRTQQQAGRPVVPAKKTN